MWLKFVQPHNMRTRSKQLSIEAQNILLCSWLISRACDSAGGALPVSSHPSPRSAYTLGNERAFASVQAGSVTDTLQKVQIKTGLLMPSSCLCSTRAGATTLRQRGLFGLYHLWLNYWWFPLPQTMSHKSVARPP